MASALEVSSLTFRKYGHRLADMIYGHRISVEFYEHGWPNESIDCNKRRVVALTSPAMNEDDLNESVYDAATLLVHT